jgi:hypothetical protein
MYIQEARQLTLEALINQIDQELYVKSLKKLREAATKGARCVELITNVYSDASILKDIFELQGFDVTISGYKYLYVRW